MVWLIQQTSLMAYHGIKINGALGRMEKIVLDGFLKHGKHTDREMLKLLGLKEANLLRPRRNGLVKKGLLIEKERRICKVGNKISIVWGVLS